MAFLSTKTGLPSFTNDQTSFINYFTDGGFERGANGVLPVGWTQYNDGAVAVPIDGTGGSADATVTMLCSNSSPIRGALSAVITKPAGNKQGIGFSFPFTISQADKGFTAGVEFDMDTDALFAAGDVVFYVYDVTNSILITPRNTSIPKLDNFGRFISDYGLTAGTSYRFILHIATVNASAWTLKLDTMVNTTTRVAVPGSLSYQYEIVNSWVLGTSAGATPVPGAGTTYYRNTWRDNDWAIVRWEFNQIAVGSVAGGGNYTLPLPSGLTVDTTRITVASISSVQGQIGTGLIQANATFQGCIVYYNGGNIFVTVDTQGAANSPYQDWGNALFSVTNTTVRMCVTARIPISQWAGSGANFGPSAQVEYVFNSSATATTDTTSFGTGIGGVLIQAFAPAATAFIQKRVQFNVPRQKGDVIELWIDDGNGYAKIEDRLAGYSENDAGTTFYGYRLLQVSGSSTQFDILFFSRVSPTITWASLTTFRWVLVKYNPLAPVGVGRADATQPGNVAPRKGQTALTVASSQAGWVTSRAVGIYYQDQDGNHRLKFNIVGQHTSATVTGITLTITGITFKNVTGFSQPCAGYLGGISTITPRAVAVENTNTIAVNSASAAGCTGVGVSGDVELDSKPTWA